MSFYSCKDCNCIFFNEFLKMSDKLLNINYAKQPNLWNNGKLRFVFFKTFGKLLLDYKIFRLPNKYLSQLD